MREIARFSLPLPPSVNELYANAPGRGRVKTAKHREWIHGAAWVAFCIFRGGPKPLVNGPYALEIALPANMRGDIDNRAKGLLDLLVHIGATPDDHHCQRLVIERKAGVAQGYADIVIFGSGPG